MRTKLSVTFTTAARELGQWPSVMSRLERGLIRNDDLASTYRQWLAEQETESTKLSQQMAGSGWPG